MIWFIIWFIGAIVSTYITFRYAGPIDMYKRILKFKNRKERIIPIIFLLFVVLGYTILSWIGAIATYVIFNNYDDKI